MDQRERYCAGVDEHDLEIVRGAIGRMKWKERQRIKDHFDQNPKSGKFAFFEDNTSDSLRLFYVSVACVVHLIDMYNIGSKKKRTRSLSG